jgi:hypothetical protein
MTSNIEVREQAGEPTRSDWPPLEIRPKRKRPAILVVGIALVVSGGIWSYPATRPSLPNPRIDITATLPPATCPANGVSLNRESTAHQRPDTDAFLIPGAPAVGTVCRYVPESKYQWSKGRLASTRTLAGSGLLSALQVLDKARAPQGTSNCGDAKLFPFTGVIFRYRSGPDLRVVVDLTGCLIVSNGDTTVFVPAEIPSIKP